jgi:hypothetical protein
MRPRIVLLDGAERKQWYTALRPLLEDHWDVDTGLKLAANAPEKIDLAVVNDERALPRVSAAVCELVRHHVPTLHVVDGILEWRNTWDNPRFAIGSEKAVPLFQPALCHKVACLGRSQARILESWGNLGKCEVVGAPRFDALLGRRPRSRRPDDPWRVLVMTARTPGFTDTQTEAVRQSLLGLKTWFDNHPRLAGTRVQPVWRLTAGVANEIGVDNSLQDTVGVDLASALETVDAVITTPSTTLLEGMLQRVPVALLDYNNCPHYVPAAWSITAPRHIDQVMPELADPPAAKMLYQETLLHDSLECCTPAVPRMLQLIEEMICIGRHCRASGEPANFPRRILPDRQNGHHLPEESFDFQTLYPEQHPFRNMDRVALQAEIGHLRRQIAHYGKYHEMLRGLRDRVFGVLRRKAA